MRLTVRAWWSRVMQNGVETVFIQVLSKNTAILWHKRRLERTSKLLLDGLRVELSSYYWPLVSRVSTKVRFEAMMWTIWARRPRIAKRIPGMRSTFEQTENRRSSYNVKPVKRHICFHCGYNGFVPGTATPTFSSLSTVGFILEYLRQVLPP